MVKIKSFLGIILVCLITIFVISCIFSYLLPNGFLRGVFNVFFAVSFISSLFLGTIYFSLGDSSLSTETRKERKVRKSEEKWQRDYFSLPLHRWLTWEEYLSMRRKFNKKSYTWEEVMSYKETLKVCEYDENIKCHYDSCHEGCRIFYKKHVGFFGKCPECNEVLEEKNHCNLCGWERDTKKRKGRYIPKSVQREVWRRDQGRCIECGSQKKLEFDHIIPFSKGGSNTARNIQLLCEECNRRKYDKIGL